MKAFEINHAANHVPDPARRLLLVLRASIGPGRMLSPDFSRGNLWKRLWFNVMKCKKESRLRRPHWLPVPASHFGPLDGAVGPELDEGYRGTSISRGNTTGIGTALELKDQFNKIGWPPMIVSAARCCGP